MLILKFTWSSGIPRGFKPYQIQDVCVSVLKYPKKEEEEYAKYNRNTLLSVEWLSTTHQ